MDEFFKKLMEQGVEEIHTNSKKPCLKYDTKENTPCLQQFTILPVLFDTRCKDTYLNVGLKANKAMP